MTAPQTVHATGVGFARLATDWAAHVDACTGCGEHAEAAPAPEQACAKPATQAPPDVHLADMPLDAPWTENQALAALYRHFTTASGGRWAPIGQVPAWEPGTDALNRRIDMLLARIGATGDLETLAIEVKVDRQDFLSDISNPAKQDTWRRIATRHAYAAPPGVIRDGEIPVGSGWLDLERLIPSKRDSPTAVSWALDAPYTPGHRGKLSDVVIHGLLVRLSTAEGEGNGWESTIVESERTLRQRVRQLEKGIRAAEREASAEKGRSEAWKKAFALASGDGLPCAWCSEPITPLRPKDGWFASWRHVDKANDDPCAVLELEDRIGLAVDAHRKALEEAPELVEARIARVRVLRDGDGVDYDATPWRAFLSLEARGPEPQQ